MALEKNTVVWASAGTGKTRKLVATYLELLDEGVDPMRIVAMTFTEKAAGEMRDRIRSAVYDRMSGLPGDARMRWMRVLSVLPAAPISTIHGFCGRLLRDHGLKIGIDPSFGILDEQQSLDMARQAVVDTIRETLREGDVEIARLFGDFGLYRLVDTVVKAAAWINSLGKTAQWLEDRARAQAEEAARLEGEGDVAEQLNAFGPDFEKVGLAVDEMEARRVRHPLRKKDDPDAVLPRIGQIAGVDVARRLTRLVDLAAIRFRSAKRSASVMDFDDLLLGARDLLRDVAAVRTHCQSHLRAVLVDEFQDTDEVQAEIIRMLTADLVEPRRFAPGKLLIVGDPKQSIYRFRRARVTVFMRMLREILDDGGVLEHLRENYRSAAPIVEFSNRLSECMMDGAGKHDIGAGVDLSYRIRFSDSDVLHPRARSPFLGITYIAAEDGVRAHEGRVMEAEAIARLLKGWKKSGAIRSWRQVALLMRSMTNVGIYTDALEAHEIPVYVVQGSEFYQKTEVSDLIALLELVLRPEDPMLRTIVMTSALMGVSFDLIKSAGPSQALDQLLQPWVEMRDRATAAEILEGVIRTTNFDVVMAAQKNGEQRFANIGKLIEITRSLARQGTTALDDVVRHLRDRARDTTIREAEAQVLGPDEDVVQVLTVHLAKGLEFDAVVIPDLAAKRPGFSGDYAFHSDRWGLVAGRSYGLHRKTLPHALILRGRKEEDDQQFEEEKRLLYVAVTRARSMLVLGEGFSGNTGPWLEWIGQMLEDAAPGALARARAGSPARARIRERGQDFTVDIVPAQNFTRPEQLMLNVDIAAVNREATAHTLEALQSNIRKRTAWTTGVDLTPSDLIALDGCFQYFQWTRVLGLSDPARRATGDTPQMRLGSLAHKIMETAVLPEPDALARQGLGDLAAVFGSTEWRDLTKAEVDRELPFLMHVQAGGQDCFVRGRMDAVAMGSPPRVIDYKFTAWKNRAEVVYDIQMTAYSLALMKSLRVDTAIAELWFLKTPMKVVKQEYRVADAETRIAGLLERYLDAIRTGTWPKSEPSYCDLIQCGFRDRCWGAASS